MNEYEEIESMVDPFYVVGGYNDYVFGGAKKKEEHAEIVKLNTTKELTVSQDKFKAFLLTFNKYLSN